ncbi:hypothetical protein J2T60_000222 [Natronospira proteinivora]|uniref:DUF4397 domain-containing protein n=1 Tax=Natronospira proteinivora TaxID=1807133 RepID=A0ABT1G4N6_9GAMM|nr:DUF4397 domain-containing protein [Natronospira proteinivora]MCP1726257.1 hypothetical protein [Natronospira proteinivora]
MTLYRKILLALLLSFFTIGGSGCFSSSSSSSDDDGNGNGDDNGEAEVTAQLRAYHASPDAGEVDIFVGEERVAEGVSFPAASAYLEVPASALTVSIVAAGGDLEDAVLSAEVSLSEDGQYTLIVWGSVESENLDTALVDDSNEGVSDGFVKVRPAHLAVGAPNVDLYVTGLDDALDEAEPVAENLAFGDIADAYIEAPAEVSRLRVTAAGDSETVIYDYVADFPQFEGASLLAGALNADAGFSPILIGAATGSDSLPFLPLIDQQSELRAVHGSPDAGDVTVEVQRAGEDNNWMTLVTGLSYREDTGYARILGDFEYEARVVLEGSGTAVPLENIEPQPGNAYSVFALGSVDDGTVAFLVEADRVGPAEEGESALRAVHGIAGGPTVDVEADGAAVIEALEELTASSFLDVAAGEYSVEVVTSDGGDNVIGPADLALGEGNVYTVVALPVDESGTEEANLLIILDRSPE